MKNYQVELAKLLNNQAIGAADVVPTQDLSFGNYCIPCFKLAKQFRKAPAAIAEELSQTLSLPEWVDKVVPVNGYLNFYLKTSVYVQDVIADFKDGVSLPQIGADKTVCIDYSSVNIAKPFHMGHLPSTAIGGSLVRILRALGYRVVGINHLGDYGTQFGKLITAFKRFGDLEQVKQGGVKELQRLYVMYPEIEEQDPSALEEARGWSLKIERGDEEATMLFETFKQITLDEVKRIYQLLGIEFDSYLGEAFFVKRVEPIVQELREKNLLVESDGAQVVALDQYGMPPCLILRSDGASLYATRDIAAAEYRKQTYQFDKCLYVVAYQQNLHFQQFFKVLELMGYDWAKDLEHIAFGMVSVEGASLSSRKGNVVYLMDVLQQAVARTKEIMTEKNSSLKDMDTVARSVGVGAVVFSALSSAKIKDVSFSLDKVLSFEGETGPYLQYTHARCCSVLTKGKGCAETLTPSGIEDDSARALAVAIAKLPDMIKDAAEKREPCMISKQLIAIASAFNKFYFDHKILTDDPAVTASRLALTRATKNALAFGMQLVLLDPVESM